MGSPLGAAARAEYERQRRQAMAGGALSRLWDYVRGNLQQHARTMQEDPIGFASGFVGSTTPVRGMASGMAYRPPVLQRDPTGRPLQRAPIPRGATENLLEAYRMDKGLEGQKAYHGSPHSFERFRDEAIGTGEGAQAFGYGHYFAESPGVAKSYRDMAKWREGPRLTIHGEPVTKELVNERLRKAIGERNIDDAAKYAAQDMVTRVWAEGGWNFDDLVRYQASQARMLGARGDKAYWEKVAENIEQLKGKLGVKDPGHMYEVGLRTKADDLLDWDLPLSQQPEKVQEALKKARLWEDPSMMPNDFYLQDPSITRRMQKEGIKGIRYKDQMSRGTEGGTHNYVMFNPKDIKILRKYGITVGPLGTLLGRDDE